MVTRMRKKDGKDEERRRIEGKEFSPLKLSKLQYVIKQNQSEVGNIDFEI